MADGIKKFSAFSADMLSSNAKLVTGTRYTVETREISYGTLKQSPHLCTARNELQGWQNISDVLDDWLEQMRFLFKHSKYSGNYLLDRGRLVYYAWSKC